MKMTASASAASIRETYKSNVQCGYAAYMRSHCGWAQLVSELKHLKARDIPTPKTYSQAINNFREWQEAITRRST